jgi:hypothetical protein
MYSVEWKKSNRRYKYIKVKKIWSFDGNNQIFKAAYTNNVYLLEQNLDSGINIDYQDSSSNTALIIGRVLWKPLLWNEVINPNYFS